MAAFSNVNAKLCFSFGNFKTSSVKTPLQNVYEADYDCELADSPEAMLKNMEAARRTNEQQQDLMLKPLLAILLFVPMTPIA